MASFAGCLTRDVQLVAWPCVGLFGLTGRRNLQDGALDELVLCSALVAGGSLPSCANLAVCVPRSLRLIETSRRATVRVYGTV